MCDPRYRLYVRTRDQRWKGSSGESMTSPGCCAGMAYGNKAGVACELNDASLRPFFHLGNVHR